MKSWTCTAALLALSSIPAVEIAGADVQAEAAQPAAAGLIGYWPLRGDCRDHSGNELHGVNHGVRLEDAAFDGRGAYIEIPASPKLQLGTGDFTLAAWVHTGRDIDDVIGDVVSRYDAVGRRGFSLTIKSTAGGYSSHGDDRHVYFGVDNGHEPTWEDCGRPSPTSNYVSNSLTVFDGHLYAAITDAEKFENWCHVFRYAGGKQWEDCCRVGDRRTHGVEPMVVHRGSLYAATWTYEFQTPNEWARVTSLTTFQGKLFASLGSCTSSRLDAPCDFRGTVWSMEAGHSVSYDRDLGPGWKHLTAIRRSDRLELHVNGQLVATSASFAPADYDLTVDCPLRIGFGEVDYFSGEIREVRLYRRALTAGELQRLAADAP